jgi:hypothetical protein
LTGKFARAAERLRSASRGRNGAKSPQEIPQPSPYESVPGMWSPSRSTTTTPGPPPMPNPGNMTERHPREVKAAMNMEGGMI